MNKKEISALTFDPLDFYKLRVSKKEFYENVKIFQSQDTFTLYDPYSGGGVYDQDTIFGFKDRVSKENL